MADILLKVRKLPYNLHMNWTLKQSTRLEFLGVDGSQFCQYAMLSGREISKIILEGLLRVSYRTIHEKIINTNTFC